MIEDIELIEILEHGYGFMLKGCIPTKGGFSSKAAYLLITEDTDEYFLKVYDNTIPTTRSYVNHIDTYMSILHKLSLNPALAKHVPIPIPNCEGGFKVEAGDITVVIFQYVSGDCPGITGITQTQTMELAEILAMLHKIDLSAFCGFPELLKDTALEQCDYLTHCIRHSRELPNELNVILSKNERLISKAVEETVFQHSIMEKRHYPLVLCHGDAHGNNVIQGKHLVLVDWEDMHIAPAEADLFISAWCPYGTLLLDTYTTAMNQYSIDMQLLRYYTLFRKLEDLSVDIKRITEEAPTDIEKVKLLSWMRESIEKIMEIVPMNSFTNNTCLKHLDE